MALKLLLKVPIQKLKVDRENQHNLFQVGCLFFVLWVSVRLWVYFVFVVKLLIFFIVVVSIIWVFQSFVKYIFASRKSSDITRCVSKCDVIIIIGMIATCRMRYKYLQLLSSRRIRLYKWLSLLITHIDCCRHFFVAVPRAKFYFSRRCIIILWLPCGGKLLLLIWPNTFTCLNLNLILKELLYLYDLYLKYNLRYAVYSFVLLIYLCIFFFVIQFWLPFWCSCKKKWHTEERGERKRERKNNC